MAAFTYAQHREVNLARLRNLRTLPSYRWWEPEDRAANIKLLQRHLARVRRERPTDPHQGFLIGSPSNIGDTA